MNLGDWRLSTWMSDGDSSPSFLPGTTMNSPDLRKTKKPSVHAAQSITASCQTGADVQMAKSLLKMSIVIGNRVGRMFLGCPRAMPRST